MNTNVDLVEQITRVLSLSFREPKSVYGILAHFMSEVGELAEAVQAQQGDLPFKKFSEPLVNEVADVIQCAVSLFARTALSTKGPHNGPYTTSEELIQILATAIQQKSDKWEGAINATSATVTPPIKVTAPTKRPANLASLVSQLAVPPATKAGKSNIDLSKFQKPNQSHPKMHVNIRKHPLGVTQPLGMRRIQSMTKKGNILSVQIAGNGGWDIDMTLPDPKFLDFIVGYSAGCNRGIKHTVAQAWTYWARNSTPCLTV